MAEATAPNPLRFDPELVPHLEQFRARLAQNGVPELQVEDILPPTLSHQEYTLLGPEGNPIVLSLFSKKNSQKRHRAGLYHIHGGGMITGNRFTTVSWALEAVEELDIVCATIEYRLAPEHPDPAPVEDCYAGLIWMMDNAKNIGVDASRLLLYGVSAGGGLAAGVALLARDRDGPRLAGQILSCPMLDDRNDSVSAHQFVGQGIWDREMNMQGWSALLGERQGTKNVSIYAAPARATNLSRLAPTFIDVGSAETFREEDLEFAQKLWRDGVQCELHVWPGGFHIFDLLCPKTALGIAARGARMAWLCRLLN
ncbi:hypothetical protein BDV12DRAFT_203755 [Aspergillus spectabilis]